MPSHKDEHGQPDPVFRAKHNADRSIDELIGVCKGVVSDGVVNQDEAEFLCGWLRANEHVRNVWPANVLRARIAEYLEDGYLDQDEKVELFEMLARVSAHRESKEPVNLSTGLPFDSPLPQLSFMGWGYCLTGKFHTGKRSNCEQFIVSLGGVILQQPRQRECVLVVGDIGSRDWIHSTHGRKIEAAITLRTQGHPVAIVPEHYWFETIRKELQF